MRRVWFVVTLALSVMACGDDASPAPDAGFDSGTDAGCVGSDCCTTQDECDDGRYCNGVETCVASHCAAGQAIACDDGIACTDNRCDEGSDQCVFAAPDVDKDGHADALCLDDEGAPLGDDCDDNDADRYPGNVEICVPDESSAEHDEDCDATTFGELDLDGDGSIDDRCVNTDALGVEHRGYDCDDTDIARHRRQMEFCDLKDNDCDITVDEDPGVVAWYADDDQDGVGGNVLVEETCQLRPLLSLRNTDCDDQDPARRTGFPEFCDGVDNNCNGVIDERLTNCSTTQTQTTQTIDECVNGISTCDDRATCTDLIDGYTCTCNAGYLGNGMSCVDIEECSNNNGGCDVLATCNEVLGGPNTCTCPSGYTTSDNGMTCVDVDECATNNGGCDVTYTTCANNVGAAPTCVDVDECATNNGGCDVTYTTCANNVGAAPTCVDVDECATNNGGCDSLTTCVNNVGAAPSCGACPIGYYGSGATGCTTLAASCKVLFDAGETVSGPYTIDPDGVGSIAAFQAYCDMTGAGGGWTLIRSSVSGGTNASVEGLPTPLTNSHLSLARMEALAAIASQVHIRTSGNPTDAITSNADSSPIVRLRSGLSMVDPTPNCDVAPGADWTGSSTRLQNFRFSCCPLVHGYPDGVFHACNFAGGLTWFGSSNGWTYGATNNLEMYFR